MKRQQKSETEQEDHQKIIAYVVTQLKAGASKEEIAQALVDAGTEKQAAAEYVNAVHDEATKVAEKERYTFASLFPAIVGAFLAAIIGGTVWGFLVKFTRYELGIAAWGMGVIAGYAVVLLAGGKKGAPLQVIAVIASLLGILVGKYLTFYFVVKEVAAEELGLEVVEGALFSPAFLQFFVQNVTLLFGLFDILWVLLAVVSAWKIPQGLGLPLPRK